jgi:hypothetical protein
MTRRPLYLHLAQPPAEPSGPTFSQIKAAIKWYRGKGVSREQCHANARKLLAMNAWLGDKHTLRGGEVRWGRPGIPFADQLMAPRRLSQGRK